MFFFTTVNIQWTTLCAANKICLKDWQQSSQSHSLGSIYTISASHCRRNGGCVCVGVDVCLDIKNTLTPQTWSFASVCYLLCVNDQSALTHTGRPRLPGGSCPHREFKVLILMCKSSTRSGQKGEGW